MTGKSSVLSKGGIDWMSVGVFFLLMLLGWVNIYAAVYDESTAVGFEMGTRYGSQLVWMGVCVFAAIVIMLVDEIYYHIAAYPLYFFMLLVLIATLFIGTEINGARSWIKIGSFTMQPVEIAKFATALALARYMSSYHFTFANWKNFLYVALIVVVPMAIIILQNDTGSAVVYLAFLMVFYREGLNGWIYVAIGMVVYLFVFSFIFTPVVLLASVILICTLLEGIMNGGWRDKLRYLAGVALGSMLLDVIINLVARNPVSFYWSLLLTSVISLAFVAAYAWRRKLRNVMICIIIFLGSLVFTQTVDYIFDHMQVHQQKRILNLLGVESDLQKWGYNVNQSKIAIGSGGFWGKGYLQGTQTKYDFVPEQSTDFIFCTVGEEWGFVGSTVVLALFCFMIIRLIRMGERQQEAFGRVYCYGVAAIFFFHVVVNVGMTIGVMPVIGIPLPLFSYGGSSLLAFTILFFVAVKLDSGRREAGEKFRNM